MLDPNATWNPNAISLVTLGINGPWSSPGVFIDSNNTAYVTDPFRQLIQVWSEGSSTPVRNITTPGIFELHIFVSAQGDIYVCGCGTPNVFPCPNPRIYRWTKDPSISRVGFNVTLSCRDVFIDMNNTLYCSAPLSSQVSKGSLNSVTLVLSITAGNGILGFGSGNLFGPAGIFVDANFSLHVADAFNNRIQRFMSGQSSGTTVAGTSAPGTITLNTPSDVVLDDDGYLFIADSNNNRIVGSGPYGFRCLVGCSGSTGTGSDRLDQPAMLSFDSHGNIFVSDTGNRRIQKFLLQNNTRGMFET